MLVHKVPLCMLFVPSMDTGPSPVPVVAVEATLAAKTEHDTSGGVYHQRPLARGCRGYERVIGDVDTRCQV